MPPESFLKEIALSQAGPKTFFQCRLFLVHTGKILSFPCPWMMNMKNFSTCTGTNTMIQRNPPAVIGVGGRAPSSPVLPASCCALPSIPSRKATHRPARRDQAAGLARRAGRARLGPPRTKNVDPRSLLWISGCRFGPNTSYTSQKVTFP